MEKNYIECPGDVTITLKDEWQLSLGYGKLDKEGNFWHYEGDWITNDDLIHALKCMKNIIIVFGIPKSGDIFDDGNDRNIIHKIIYNCDKNELHIELI